MLARIHKGVKAMIGGNNSVKSGTIADFFCDNASDVANLPQYAEDHKLSMGSSCYCIDTSTLYILKSDGTWKAQ